LQLAAQAMAEAERTRRKPNEPIAQKGKHPC